MAFFVVIWVLILYRDDVAIEVFLSRPIQSRQEVRCRDRVWPWPRNFMPRQIILCRYRVWSRPRVVLFTTWHFYVAMSRRNIFMSRQSSGQGQKVSCCDNIFLGRNKLWLRQKGFRVVTKYIVSRQGVAKTKGPCVATKQFVS